MSKRKDHEKVPADPQPQTGAAAGPAGSAVPAADPLVETGAGGAAETGPAEQQGKQAGPLPVSDKVNDDDSTDFADLNDDADKDGRPAPGSAADTGADLGSVLDGSGSLRDSTAAPVAGEQPAATNGAGNAGLDGEGGTVLGALDGEDLELAYIATYGGPFAYYAVHAAWSGIYPLMEGTEAGALLRELLTPAATRDLADLIRRIGASATVPVLASQLMLSRHRDDKELNRLEVLALDVFSHTLLALEGYKARSIEIEAEEARLANAVPPPPVPIEETTLETVDGPGDSW